MLRGLKLHRGQTWSALPSELWEEIFKRLPMSDQIRFASVSKNWLSIAATKPPPPPVPDPWLIFPSTKEFLSLSQKRIYKFDDRMPPNESDCRIAGTCNGWVLTTQRLPHPIGDCLVLVNPNSHAEVYFKSPTIPYGDLKKPHIVSYVDSVLRLFITYTSPHVFYDHITLYNGKLYCLKIHKSESTFAVYGFRYDEKLTTLQWEQLYQFEEIEAKTSREELEAYLVVSNGDLLLVKRQILRRNNVFEVFKLVLGDEATPAHCVKLQSLGDEALFWDRDGCISLPVGKFSLFKENHIYFSVPKSRDDIGQEIGVYSLKCGRTRKLFSLPRKTYMQDSIWFVPTYLDKQELTN